VCFGAAESAVIHVRDRGAKGQHLLQALFRLRKGILGHAADPRGRIFDRPAARIEDAVQFLLEPLLQVAAEALARPALVALIELGVKPSDQPVVNLRGNGVRPGRVGRHLLFEEDRAQVMPNGALVAEDEVVSSTVLPGDGLAQQLRVGDSGDARHLPPQGLGGLHVQLRKLRGRGRRECHKLESIIVRG